MIGVKSDKRHVGQEHGAVARKAKGWLSIPRAVTDGGGHSRGRGDR